MTTARHEGGASANFEGIAAQHALLTSQRQLALLNGQRLIPAAYLIKALGGGWDGTFADPAEANSKTPAL